jgi:peptide/nickel transport system substrate-binding protein
MKQGWQVNRCAGKKKRKLKLFAVGMASVMTLSACGSTSSPAAGKVPTTHTLHLAFLGDISQPPDPDVYYAGQALLIIMNTYDQLVSYKLNSAKPVIVPDLATSWTISPDGKTYTFQLRKGVVFHDGTPFTCSAIPASFERRAAVDGGPAYQVSQVASVDCPNPYEAVIHLKQPVAAFLNYLASAYGPKMESPTELAKHKGSNNDQTWLASHDAGSGPYYLAKADPGSEYVLKAFPKYWGHKPYYTTVDIKVIPSITTQLLELQDGQLNGILHSIPTTAISSLRKDSNVKLYVLPTFESTTIYVNPAAPLFAKLSVRQAFMHAINKEQVIQAVFPGRAEVLNRIYPRNMLANNQAPEISGYDPSAFKQALKNVPSSEKNLIIGYQSNSPSMQLVANVLQTQLASYGLNVKVVAYPGSTVYNWAVNDQGAPQLFAYSSWPDAASPYTWAHITFDPGGGLNFFHCSVPEATKLLAEGNASVSQSQANQLFAQAGTLYGESGCWNMIASRNDTFALSSYLTGIVHNVGSPFTLYLQYLHPRS